MTELLCFQEFGIRKSIPHVIDPSVIIEIQESIINNANNSRLTGVLFGKQQANNLIISAVLVTPIGELTEDSLFLLDDNMQSLLKYYERVYSLNCVGLFSRKSDFDFECYIQNSNAFQFKNTTDFIFLTVDFDVKTTDFSIEAYSSLRNKYFKELFVVFQQVPIRIGFVEENYMKGFLISGPGYLFC